MRWIVAILSASVANVMQATTVARSLSPHALLATAFLYGALMDAALAWADVRAELWAEQEADERAAAGEGGAPPGS